MELGKKIRQLRFKAGLTQEQLAEKLGIGAQSVSKWENAVAMPDITTLPMLAEIFGVTIDDMFDLTTDQRMNRIENRLDMEDDLPRDVFAEYEEFLKARLEGPEKKRATELIAYLYWHRMQMYSQKAARFAKEAVRMTPGEKGCQWILNKAEGHAAWDWNMRNHTGAVEFYRELCAEHPGLCSPHYYLMDNLIADHRADEAEKVLKHLRTLKDADPVLCEVYRAHIALARFDEGAADGIIEELLKSEPDNDRSLFEAAQYYAEKCDYDRALALYEESFEKSSRRPRFQDELMAIRDIHEIRGEYREAAAACDRILELLMNEWGITEGDELKNVQRKKQELLEKAK